MFFFNRFISFRPDKPEEEGVTKYNKTCRVTKYPDEKTLVERYDIHNNPKKIKRIEIWVAYGIDFYITFTPTKMICEETVWEGDNAKPGKFKKRKEVIRCG